MLKRFFKKGLVEAGCDEAGRGCLAGPVFAAAVILPKKFFHPLLNDSKQMTEEERDEAGIGQGEVSEDGHGARSLRLVCERSNAHTS